MRPGARSLLAVLLSLSPLAAGAQTLGYAAGYDTLYKINLQTAQAEVVGRMEIGAGSALAASDVEGLAFARDGGLYAVADATPGGGLFRIDRTTGIATFVGNLGLQGQGAPPNDNLDVGLAVGCDGRMWLSSDTAQKLWEVTPATAATRLVGTIGKKISGLAARADGLYGIGVDTDAGLYRIDTETARPTLIGSFGSSTPLPDAGLDFDADGTLWAVLDRFPPTETSEIATIDTVTGQQNIARVVNGEGLDDRELEALAIAPPVCQPTGNGPPAPQLPIPAASRGALGALALGVLLLGFLGLRRRGLAVR
jgi:hypothetical protein